MKNKIQIISVDTFRIIDVLKTGWRNKDINCGHCSDILCFDIAEISKDIVSYSSYNLEKQFPNRTLIVFGLEDQSYLNGLDLQVTQAISDATNGRNFQNSRSQHLKWKEYWRCDQSHLAIQTSLNTISISPIGDALLFGGNQFLSLWTRDSQLSAHSYSLHLVYGQNLDKNIFAQQVEEQCIEEIVKSEFTGDGRAFITLEKTQMSDLTTLKVWFNQNLRFVREELLDKKKDFISRQERMKNNQLIHLEKLGYFEVPNPRSQKICDFKIYPSLASTYGKQDKIIPIIFIAITEKAQVCLWMEDMILPGDYISQNLFSKDLPGGQYSGMTFTCIHTFSQPQGLSRNLSFDASFLCPQSHDYYEADLNSQSKILDSPNEDYIQSEKVRAANQSDKLFGNIYSSYLQKNFPNSVSKDFIVMINRNSVLLYSIYGMRNLSQFQIGGISVKKEFTLSLDLYNNSTLNPRYALLCEHNSLIQTQLHDSILMADDISIVGFNAKSDLLVKVSKRHDSVSFQIDQIKEISGNLGSQSQIHNVQYAKSGSHGTGRSLIAMLRSHKADSNDQEMFIYKEDAVQACTAYNGQNLSEPLDLLGIFKGQYSDLYKIKNFKWVNLGQTGQTLGQLLVLHSNNHLQLIQSSALSNLIALGNLSKHGLLEFSQLGSSVCLAEVHRKIVDFGILKHSTCREKLKIEGLINRSSLTIYVILEDSSVDFVTLEVNYELQSFSIQNSQSTNTSENIQTQEVLCAEELTDYYEGNYYERPAAEVRCMLKQYNKASQRYQIQYLVILDGECKELWTKVLPSAQSTTQRGGLQASSSQALGYELTARMSKKYATVLTRNVKKAQYYLYFYEHQSLNKYVGYLDLLSSVDFEPHDSTVLLKQGFAVDYFLTGRPSVGETLVLWWLDCIYLIAFSSVQGKWLTARRINCVTGLNVSIIKSVTLSQSPHGSLLAILNERQLVCINMYLQVLGQNCRAFSPPRLTTGSEEEIKETQVGLAQLSLQYNEQGNEESLAEVAVTLQKSHSIYSVQVLRELFINGKIEFIMTLMIQLNNDLKQGEGHAGEIGLLKGNSDKQVSAVPHELKGSKQNFARIINQKTMPELLFIISKYIESQVTQLAQNKEQSANQPGSKSKPKKQTEFDDFFGGDDDSDDNFDLMDAGEPRHIQKSIGNQQQIFQNQQKKQILNSQPLDSSQPSKEQAFLEIFDELLANVVKAGSLDKELPNFLLAFAGLYTKDYFSDELATILLREIYLETEIVDQDRLKELYAPEEQASGHSQVVAKLAAHEIYAQMYRGKDSKFTHIGAGKSEDRIAKLRRWDSRRCALALYTANQDVVLDELTQRFELEDNASWDLIRDLCIPAWTKDSYKLRQMVEWVAKVAYKIAGEEATANVGRGLAPASPAEAASLWYLLINKKTLLINLFQKEQASGGDKVATMLSQDFSVDRWRKAALKNAMVLRQKQRYLLCATFFILGGDVPSALQVMRQSLADPMMAILTCRMLQLQSLTDGSLRTYLEEIYEEHFIKRGQEFGDVYLASIGFWNQQKYVQAVNALHAEHQEMVKQASIDRMFSQESGLKLRQVAFKRLGGSAQQKNQPLRGQEDPENDPKDELSPVISEHSGYELLLLLEKLRKAPLVTQALKKEKGTTGYGADVSDIFADFLGASSSNHQALNVVKPKIEEKPAIIVMASELLTQALNVGILRHDPLNLLFLARENRDLLRESVDEQYNYIKLLCLQILTDQIIVARQHSDCPSPNDLMQSQISCLLDFLLGTNQDKQAPQSAHTESSADTALLCYTSKQKICSLADKLQVLKGRLQRSLEQELLDLLIALKGPQREGLGGCSLLRFETELRMEAGQRHLCQNLSPLVDIPKAYCSQRLILLRIEEETLKYLRFIESHTEQPFLDNTSRSEELSNLFNYRTLVCGLELQVSCLMYIDHCQESSLDGPIGASQAHHPNQDLQEIIVFKDFRRQKDPSGKSEVDSHVADGSLDQLISKPQRQFSDDFMAEDDSDEIDLMDLNFSAQPKAKVIKQKSKEPIQKVVDEGQQNNEALADQIRSQRLSRTLRRLITDTHRLSSKARHSVVIYLCLLVLANLMGKFYAVKDLLSKEGLPKVAAETHDVKKSLLECLQIKKKMREKGLSKEQLLNLEQSLSLKLKTALLQTKAQHEGSHFENLKAQIQRFKCSVERKISEAQEIWPRENLGYETQDDQWEKHLLPDRNQLQQPRGLVVEDSIYQEKWETQLLNAEDSLRANLGQASSEIQVNSNGIEQLLGTLSKSGQVVPETYEFIRIWLRFLVVHRTKEVLEGTLSKTEDLGWPTDEIDSCEFFHHFTVAHTSGEGGSCREIEAEENIQQSLLEEELANLCSTRVYPRFSSGALIQRFRQASRALEDQCTAFFNQKLNVFQRRYLMEQISAVSTSLHLFPILMHHFFRSQEHLTEFWQSLGVAKTYVKPLYDQYLNLLGQSCTAPQEEYELLEKLTYPPALNALSQAPGPPKSNKEKRESATQVLTRSLFGVGIELFKQRGEQITDFAFDNTSASDNIALSLLAPGIREVPVVSTLQWRNRVERGLQLIDDENLTWEECLHRYDALEQLPYKNPSPKDSIPRQPEIVSAKDDSITAAVDTLFAHKTIFQRTKPLNRQGLLISDAELAPAQVWNGCLSAAYLTRASKLDITHEDYTNAIESHPFLPLYISGNRRGILCTWKFGQVEDKSLHQFIPEIDPRQADPKKACVKKIMLSSYGDKVMSNNLEGSFAIYQLEGDSRSTRKVPVFSLSESVDSKVTDFDLVNSDNIICTISQKSKTVKIYDTLLPYGFGRQAQVMEVRLPHGHNSGNFILCNQRKQTLYTFNGRTGAMTELDLRMNLQPTHQFQLSQSHEVTAVCLNSRKDTLITGYKDGHIKIHAVDRYYESYDPTSMQDASAQLRLRDKIEAFPFDVRGRKGTVQKIKINMKNGGVFASSSSGLLKLIRTSV